MVSNPKISVIVPLYNCIEYFPQCMDSILAQSFKDFEIIVVDDGSTDGSYELAEQYAKTNGNVIVLQQEHRFAGVARNTGMGHARGEYLIFLDSDDYFEENLLHDALARIEETNADICAFGAKSLNNQTGIVTTLRHTCMIDLCPSSGVFNRTTNPRYLFCFTTPAPWTKLFRKSFIERNGLLFQNTRSAN
ncbi:glycosyltransferase family 2 protein, partial [Eggerthella sp.]